MMRTWFGVFFVSVAVWLFYTTSKCHVVGLPLLVFPPTSPTRIQMICGIGIPAALNFESVTFGYVIKVEYFLPENATNVLNILNDPFDVTTRPISDTGRHLRKRRRVRVAAVPKRGYDAEQRQHFERYEAVAVEVDAGPNVETLNNRAIEDDYEYESVDDIATEMTPAPPTRTPNEGNNIEDDMLEDETLSPYTATDARVKERNNLFAARFTLYHSSEAILQRNGVPGRPCMLRSICEAAHAPFSYHNGILGELAHIILSPSTSPDPIIEHADGEYLRAEQLGRAGEPCGQVFRECPFSVLEKFSGMYNIMGGLMNVLG